MIKFAGLLILLLVAGCSTAPVAPATNWSAQNNVPKPVSEPTNAVARPVLHSNVPPAVAKSNLPPATNAARPAPIVTWSSLSEWAARHQLAPPHRIAESPLVEYAIASKNGVLVLGIGSREATWNGTEITLGFPPEFIDGQLFVHGLDLEKNFEPLLCDPPLEFRPSHRVIALDPGHGGMNSGTISVLDKRPEKEFTLDLARRLKPLLEAEGWTVYLTRTNDTDLALSNRVAFAEAHHADCFISLHFNSAAPDKKENGLETYCITPTGMPSTLTRGFADPLNEVLPNNAFDAQNLQFAVRLQGVIARATGEEDRGVRRARFIGVLRGEKRPAVLIEGGFLSNPAEAARIENPAFRQKLAEAIAHALAFDDKEGRK